MTSTTVILTGVGLDGGPDIIRALRADQTLAARVVGTDANPRQAGRYLCDAFHEVPERHTPGYVDRVATIAEEEQAQVIYPLPSADQSIFASAKHDLQNRGLVVPVSPLEAVITCDDKWAMHERLRASVPEVLYDRRPVASVAEIETAARELGYPQRRVCIRRRTSRGAIGFRVLDGGPSRIEALLNENPGSPGSLLVSLEEILDCFAQAEPFPTGYLVEEYLPGPEWDVDVLCREGESVVVVPRRNLEMTGGGAVRSAVEPASHITALTRRVVADLGLDAVVNLSFRFDESGAPKLLEINPRIPMCVLSGVGGGVNLVALAVRQALGEAVGPAEPDYGGMFLRHFGSVIIDGHGSAVLA